jgi:hypothetical protein
MRTRQFTWAVLHLVGGYTLEDAGKREQAKRIKAWPLGDTKVYGKQSVRSGIESIMALLPDPEPVMVGERPVENVDAQFAAWIRLLNEAWAKRDEAT